MSNLNNLNTLNNEAKKVAIKADIDNVAQTVTFNFEHGKKISIDCSKLSEDIKTHAMLHGLKQKLGDAAAIARDTSTGKPATIETKFQAMQEVLDRLLNGDWNKHREGGQESGGLLLQALASVYATKTLEQLKAFLEPLSNGEKQALKLEPSIAKAIHAIQAQRTPKEINVKSLLSGLGEASKPMLKPIEKVVKK